VKLTSALPSDKHRPRFISWKPPKKELAILIGILLFNILLKTFFWAPSDFLGSYHVLVANDIIKGKYVPGHCGPWPDCLYSLQLMMVYPIAFFYAIFGVSFYSSVIYPFLSSLGNVVLVFLIGKELFDKNTGLISAFFLTLVQSKVEAIQFEPLLFFMSLSVFWYIKAEKTKKSSYFLFSGAAGGLAYLVKEHGVLIFVFYFCMFIYEYLTKRKLDLKYIYIGVGLFSVLSIEGLVFYLKSGDFLLSYNERIGYFSKANHAPEFNTDLMFYPNKIFGPSYNLRLGEYGFFYLLEIVSIAYLIKKRPKNWHIPLIWLISLFLYLQFGTMSLTKYLLINRRGPYLLLLNPPAAIILANLARYRRLVFLVVLCLLFLGIGANLQKQVPSTPYRGDIHYGQRMDVMLIYEFLRDQPKKDIYADSHFTLPSLNYLFNFERANNLKSLGGDCAAIKDAYIIVNSTLAWVIQCPEILSKGELWRWECLASERINSFPSCVFNPPENWIKIKTIKSGYNISPYDQYDPIIYYAPGP